MSDRYRETISSLREENSLLRMSLISRRCHADAAEQLIKINQRISEMSADEFEGDRHYWDDVVDGLKRDIEKYRDEGHEFIEKANQMQTNRGELGGPSLELYEHYRAGV